MPPKIPSPTCTLLNDIIDGIKDLASHCEEEYNSHWDVKHLIGLVEEVRSANSALRENAEYYMEEADRCSAFEEEYESLKADNEYLTNQVSQLEKELKEAEETIENYHTELHGS